MKNTTRGNARVVVVVILVIVGLVALSLVNRACNTASRMADQTVFNADKHVWTYEQFRHELANYEQYKKQMERAGAELKKLEDNGVGSGNQRYDNVATERDGARQMMNRIAANYNAKSMIFYQEVWKGQGLPERLE